LTVFVTGRATISARAGRSFAKARSIVSATGNQRIVMVAMS
jgi:hypothetical protein